VIRINTSDGSTFKLDLKDEKQAKRLIELLGDYEFQKHITAITAMRQYSRRHRCPTRGCKRLTKMVCPVCGEVDDGGSFSYTGNQYTLVRPNTFERVSFSIEDSPTDVDKNVNGGEKLICNAGSTQLTIMVYSNQPSARVTLRKIGEQRYNPNVR
jgi:hypothetical protein